MGMDAKNPVSRLETGFLMVYGLSYELRMQHLAAIAT
jgi:hypothetical protein